MTREEIKKQWELEFGVKYEDYQRANVYTAVDILDFAESVVNKLLISGIVEQSTTVCEHCKSKNVTTGDGGLWCDDCRKLTKIT